MKQRRLSQLLGSALVVLLLLACGGEESTPTAPNTATSAPAPTAVSTATPAPTPTTAANTPTPAGAPTETPAEPQTGVNVTTNVPFSDIVLHKLDVYAPTEDGAWPVVLVLHDLSMGMNTKGAAPIGDLSTAIAEQGAVVYAVAWASNRQTPEPWTREAAEDFPETLRYWSDTLSCAVRFARASAADYGGDPEHVIVFGQGLGGVYGLRQALAGDEAERLWDEFEAARGGPAGRVSCLASDVSASPDAFVGYGAPYALLEYLKGEDNELLDGASPETLVVYQETGAKFGQDPELWQVASSYARIGDNPNLQVRLIQGEEDSLASGDADWEMNAQLLQALVDAGYDATLTVVPDGHQFRVDGESGRAILDAIAELSGE